MKRSVFAVSILILTLLASFFWAGGTQQAMAETTDLANEAGISAYVNVGPIADMASLKSAFLSIEYQELDGSFFIGLVDTFGYSDEYDPHVLVHQEGWIVAYYPVSSASKVVDVIARNIDQTMLEKAVIAVGAAGGFTVTSVSYYDFAQPDATTMLLIAEYQADGNAFTLNIPSTNIYYEKSYAFYRYYEPSFTLDNDLIDQVNFVLTNADYFNPAVYGTIYGHFGDLGEIDFGADLTHTFTVWNRDFYAFGALAILYSGTDPITIADADYVSEISLVAPAGLPELTYDYTPTAPDKLSPVDGATGVVLKSDIILECQHRPQLRVLHRHNQ